MGIWAVNHGVLVKIFVLCMMVSSVICIGANWGTQSTHPLPPSTIVKLLRDNGIQKVKLFDVDPSILYALGGSGIEVTVGIPNDMLSSLANSVAAAELWVQRNVSAHISSNSVDIRYVAVGNEPFLTTLNGTYTGTTYPALQNVQAALIKAGLGTRVKNNGIGNLSIIVGEVGWPTDGDLHANIQYAQRFNQGFMSHMGKGTPMRPGTVDAYLFSLIDEDAKSIKPGNFERHWGVFNYDGTPKYNLSLGSNSVGLVAASNVQYLSRQWCVMSSNTSLDDTQVAPSVSYACSHADCTSLGYGTSCGNLDARGNISYAFNSYYQENNQLLSACQFPGLSVVTTTDPSQGVCVYKVMIRTSTLGGGANVSSGFLSEPSNLLLLLFMILLTLL
ncbi:glucan endo-1,3-beta-glucosidase 5-like isoform X2 [Coffea eugenioides]|uniref:Glucan endo-1,3-beta-glucosidase 5-like isoform X2 n=1 Tax=Coffea arabica TaxID=13443 RepID=A0A6P6X6R5_COFAR|nr:glucan endo-1,3-beta-glucosidase 5-like isoform X2 [Coffea arabica]XP_027157460.1 glucan endo-1,3-beta-glucosidase 5-like isoform X2 [Coffea eugenioides]